MFNIRGYVPRSIPSKVPFVKDLIASSNHIMFALTETWLEGHKDAEVYIIDANTVHVQKAKLFSDINYRGYTTYIYIKTSPNVFIHHGNAF